MPYPDNSPPTTNPDDKYEEYRRRGAAQAAALREQARIGGLRFEAYLPSDLAIWLLDKIERGVFTDPSEATFVLLGEQRDLEPHTDLRQQVLSRSIQAAADDPRPGIPLDEVMRDLEQEMAAPRPEPAIWSRQA